jgi:hypothetical protein
MSARDFSGADIVDPAIFNHRLWFGRKRSWLLANRQAAKVDGPEKNFRVTVDEFGRAYDVRRFARSETNVRDQL